MPILDIFRTGKLKSEIVRLQKENVALRDTLAETDKMSYTELKQAITGLESKRDAIEQQTAKIESDFNQQSKTFDEQIAAKRNELIELDDEVLLQSFGFYKTQYDLQNSDAYKSKLEQIRAQQAAIVKSSQATTSAINWTVNNSRKEGERMIRDYVKLILRSFNNECDASIIKVKFNNIESIEKKIRKAYETLNNLGQRMSIAITPKYLDLKVQELRLAYEYEVKKQEEKEEQKRLREQIREEAKVMKEIEEMKLSLGKEEKHFDKALEHINDQIQKTTSQSDLEMLNQEKAKIEQRLGEIEKNKQDIANREQNTRAGYVYVISNLGAFGENVYKIGVTRRLDPTERVDELGDASVPFNYDIHATIFSDDAPALENALHKAFDRRRLNMINRRREFFSVTLTEIEEVVRSNFSKPVEFTKLADAAEYRQSIKLREPTNM